MKYIYFYLFLTLAIGNHFSIEKQLLFSKKTEQEKDINQPRLYTKINREIEFYSYEILVGNSIPLNKNLSDNFKKGELIALCIKTPYKSPKILNRLTFNISSEISIKNFIYKENSIYDSNYNMLAIYLLLNKITDRPLSLAYGVGISHISQGSNKSLAPAFKINAEYKLNFNNFYNFLINNHVLNKRKEIHDFIKNLNILIGFAPELIPKFAGIEEGITLSSDIFFKINLFNL